MEVTVDKIDQSREEQASENWNHIPTDVLVIVFSNLRLADLCSVEGGSFFVNYKHVSNRFFVVEVTMSP